MGPYSPWAALDLRTPGWGLASSQCGWDFHALRGGIDPGGHRFRPRFVGVVDVRKGPRCGKGTLSSPGVAGSSERQVEV